jgi:yeast amino acid transporter
MGWDYAIQWLTILPFEITAATLTLEYWSASRNLDHAVWVTVFLVALAIIQVFGIRGYGEVEFVLSIIKIIACTGFMILAIIINTGGVPTDNRGYIGGRYWTEPNAPFKNGFPGFCSVFVTAAFAFGGTELTGLAAAEAANPLKSIPMATKQVLWRISFFYIVLLLLVGLIISSNNRKFDHILCNGVVDGH